MPPLFSFGFQVRLGDVFKSGWVTDKSTPTGGLGGYILPIVQSRESKTRSKEGILPSFQISKQKSMRRQNMFPYVLWLRRHTRHLHLWSSSRPFPRALSICCHVICPVLPRRPCPPSTYTPAEAPAELYSTNPADRNRLLLSDDLIECVYAARRITTAQQRLNKEGPSVN